MAERSEASRQKNLNFVFWDVTLLRDFSFASLSDYFKYPYQIVTDLTLRSQVFDKNFFRRNSMEDITERTTDFSSFKLHRPLRKTLPPENLVRKGICFASVFKLSVCRKCHCYNCQLRFGCKLTTLLRERIRYSEKILTFYFCIIIMSIMHTCGPQVSG